MKVENAPQHVSSIESLSTRAGHRKDGLDELDGRWIDVTEAVAQAKSAQRIAI